MTYLRTLHLSNGNTIQISRQKGHQSSVEITLALLHSGNKYDEYDVEIAKAEGARMQTQILINEVLNAEQ